MTKFFPKTNFFQQMKPPEKKSSYELAAVAIGGGNGLSTLLSGMKHFAGENCEKHRGYHLNSLSAIVTVSDDGGSSGRLRDEFNILPPGDIRSCMVALSEDETLLSKLFQHRFSGKGELGGHSFGNLFLAALTEVTGDFAEAVRLSSEVLAVKGRIFPATTSDVRLAARFTDGRIICGESSITAAHSVIEELWLEPRSCEPLPEALAAIEMADVITVGPGSLFTSLIPPFLVEGVAEAVARSSAIKIFICNLMTQPGETDGFTARRHLEVFRHYVPQIEFDCVVANNRRISAEQTARYALEGARQIGLNASLEEMANEKTEFIFADLLDENEKVRHHPRKLARNALNCAINSLVRI